MNKYKYVGNLRDGIKTKSGFHIATGFERIVHGGRGAYVEFAQYQIYSEFLMIPVSEEWRLNSDVAYYLEYRTIDSSNTKVYFQRRKVDYADYKLDYFYISPIYLEDFIIDGKYELL